MSADVIVLAKNKAGSNIEVISSLLKDGAMTHSFGRAPSVASSKILDLTNVPLGYYTLHVQFLDHPEFVFSVKLVQTGGVKRIAFQGEHPACCTISSQNAKKGAVVSRTVHQLRFQIESLHEEIVLVAGWDYSGGSDFTRYAKARRDELYDGVSYGTGVKKTVTKLVNDDTIVTMFDFKSGNRIRWIKGRNGWHKMDEVLQGTVATHTSGNYDDSANLIKRRDYDSISITHIYDYVAAIGATAPESIKSFDMFSHAWDGGPILVNTYQETSYSSGALSAQRDPKDKDGRTKDFDSINFPLLGDFKNAFSLYAEIKIWGCRAVEDYRSLIRAAQKQTDPKVKFKIKYGGSTVEITAEQIKQYFVNVFPESYMGKMASAIGLSIYGAPPGMGANLRSVGKRDYMYVDKNIYKKSFQWLDAEFGLNADDLGYISYKP